MEKKFIIQRPKRGVDYRELYLKNLIAQFKSATGNKHAEANSKEIVEEFFSWLTERKDILDEFKYLLFFMDIDYGHPMTAEVGKGITDSAVTENNKTTIITPYTFGMKKGMKNTIIKGDLIYVPENYTKRNLSFGNKPIDSFMTHNPYNEKNIMGWDELHNKYNYQITLGAFGKTYDKDKEEKIAMLKRIRDNLEGSYKEESVRINDNYLYVVSTDPKRRILGR